MTAQPKSMRIMCPSWRHVEVFYGKKLTQGRHLKMRVPFEPQAGTEITLALELPNQMVVAVDAKVTGGEAAGDKFVVKLDLVGLTDEVVARLQALVADGKRSVGSGEINPPTDESLREGELVAPAASFSAAEVADEVRTVFLALEKVLAELRTAAAHDVLRVDADCDVPTLRKAYFSRIKEFHPDLFGHYASAAVAFVAQEVVIQINRAYDRMRRAAAAAGKAVVAGPSLLTNTGWLVGWEQIEEPEAAPEPAARAPSSPTVRMRPRDASEPASNPSPKPGTGVRFSEAALFGDLEPAETADAEVSVRSRPGTEGREAAELVHEGMAAIEAGDYAQARSALASALKLEPRNRPVRALYHVAYGHELLGQSKAIEATTQFEAALVHDPDCEMATLAMKRMRTEPANPGLLKRWFKP